MRFIFHPEAEKELNNAIDYYNDCRNNLGREFALEVHSTIRLILTHPESWSIIDEDVRRALVKRFPYGVLYSLEKNYIFILAVMNLHRGPDYWKVRKV
jgi:plasmid stabilization system protein ParE